MNRKWMIGGALMLVVALAGYSLWGLVAPQTPATAPTAQPEPLAAPLVVDARVVPVQYAALSLNVGGVVERVLVEEGEQVATGDLLVQLDQSHQRARLNNAEAALAEAQASLDALLGGAGPEDIAVAEAQLAQAQAQLRQVDGSITPEDVRAAQAQVTQANALLERLAAGPDNADRRALEAQLAQAQHNLSLQHDQLSANKTNAELRVQQAAVALEQAQVYYSSARWHWLEVERTGRDPISPTVPNPVDPTKKEGNTLNDAQKQEYKDALLSAEAELQRAEQAVQEALVAAEAARRAESEGIQAAEFQVAQAQATLDRLLAGADRDTWAAARAQLAAGQANLAALYGDQPLAHEVAQAALIVAQANLARLQAPAPESELVLARARVQSARAELEDARLALADTELRAPFAGTIAALDLREHELGVAAVPVVQLAELSSWQIETLDLTELSIAQVQAGAPATITFDALPEVELTGHVVRIRQYGDIRQGDITYTALIQSDSIDSRLYWNMTATVAITPSGALGNTQ